MGPGPRRAVRDLGRALLGVGRDRRARRPRAGALAGADRAPAAPRVTIEATTGSAAETEALGARIAAGLRAGDVVTVAGELGSGKTTFVRGACRALGVSGPVTS